MTKGGRIEALSADLLEALNIAIDAHNKRYLDPNHKRYKPSYQMADIIPGMLAEYGNVNPGVKHKYLQLDNIYKKREATRRINPASLHAPQVSRPPRLPPPLVAHPPLCPSSAGRPAGERRPPSRPRQAP